MFARPADELDASFAAQLVDITSGGSSSSEEDELLASRARFDIADVAVLLPACVPRSVWLLWRRQTQFRDKSNNILLLLFARGVRSPGALGGPLLYTPVTRGRDDTLSLRWQTTALPFARLANTYRDRF